MQDRRIDSIVAAHAAQRPHRPAIAFQDTELTYAGLEAEVARMVKGLRFVLEQTDVGKFSPHARALAAQMAQLRMVRRMASGKIR